MAQNATTFSTEIFFVLKIPQLFPRQHTKIIFLPHSHFLSDLVVDFYHIPLFSDFPKQKVPRSSFFNQIIRFDVILIPSKIQL